MSDNSVSNVNRVDMQGAQMAQASQTAGQQAAPKEAVTNTAPKVVEAARKEAAQEAAAQVQAKQAQVPLISRETNLKFQVDAKSHQVTIMIMDRATNKVITTIPPDKIKDVPPGDLLQYMI
jgi:uncharacterized FlaG/YvyC family protein